MTSVSYTIVEYSPKHKALGLRILQVRKGLGLKQPDFGELFGVKRSTVINWEGGRTRPSRAVLEAMANEAAESLQWLLSGDRRDMPPEGFPLPPADLSLPMIPIMTLGGAQAGGVSGEDLNRLPLGYPRTEEGRQYWEGDDEHWITRPADIKDITAYAVIVEGDSMVRTLRPGQLVIASPIKPVVSGDLAVVRAGGSTYIKEVHFIEDGARVRLESHNPEYKALVLLREEVEFCHAIVWIKVKR